MPDSWKYLGDRKLASLTIEGRSIYQLLIESVRDYAIFVLDAEGRVATWNIGAERLKGYKPSEIIGRHFSTFYGEEDLKSRKPWKELEVAIAEGRVEDEGWRIRKDGTRFWANVIITALRDDSGNLVGFAKVTRDLTERRLAELKAIDDARRLSESEAANKAKADFLAAMSHELRTPLNAIGGFAQLMAMGVHGPVSEQQKEDLDRISASQRHLLGIINDILNFSRIEAGRIEYHIVPFDLASTIRSVFDMVQPLALNKSINLEIQECPPGISGLADISKTEQILINLVSNAVNFTPAGGTISIGCGFADSGVWIRVRDTGVGIAEDKLESIFEPFVQVGRSFTTGHRGTGLGLAISREMARGMSGDLTVESELGKGSSFTVWLPMA
ncbi:MAG TPA: ATP-binding protein [Gemmatimonadaceae bacterium]|nr:ATP-binding protein [Gemmatimonadaceae bacterium]